MNKLHNGSKTSQIFCAAVFLAAAGGGGCGSTVPAGMLRVRGEVQHAGAALPDGTILFEAVNGKGSAAGRILSNGRFESVMLPGDYRVAVRSYDGIFMIGDDGKQIRPKSRIPERMGSIATSGITVTITPEGNPLVINLE